MRSKYSTARSSSRPRDQQHHQVGAVFCRLDLRQIGRLDAYLGVVRERDVKNVAQEPRGELRIVAKEQNKCFVREGRHIGQVA